VKATYKYLADGTKLAATADTLVEGMASVKDGIVYVTQRKGFDYLGSLVYTNENNVRTLESTNFAGGRINKTTNGYDINYFITDHLGSTRVIVDNSGTIKGQYNYYPFGKQWEDLNLMANTNRYTFSGKEKQTVKDLGWLDFTARMYANSEIPMFTTQDPLAEKYYSLSPYMYCAGNPLKYVDPNGKRFIPSLILPNVAKKGAKEIVRGTANSILTVVGVTQIIIGTPFIKNGKHPDWATPLQWAEDDKLEQKHSWMQDKLSWEDGKDVIKNTLGAILLFTPFSNESGLSGFAENTVISTGISTVANEVLPSQIQSENETNSSATNNNESSQTPATAATQEATQKLLDAAKAFYDLIKYKIGELLK
jgi:RHS repeat-associated protein